MRYGFERSFLYVGVRAFVGGVLNYPMQNKQQFRFDGSNVLYVRPFPT